MSENMLTESTFDLAVLVKQVSAEHSDEPSPSRIAELVLPRIPADRHAELLAKLLPRYVGETLRRIENVVATSPRIAWEDTLGERVPTGDGYRFLRDCHVEDVRAGASRRRLSAEALNRRADLYDEIARRLEDGSLHVPAAPEIAPEAARGPAAETPTPAGLSPRVGVEIMIHHQGYRMPWGVATFEELPPHLRPTINEILDELNMLPLDVLVAQMRTRPDLLDKVAIGAARGWASTELDTALESDDLVELFYQSLLRVLANLDAAAAHRRLEFDERARRRMGHDIRAVRERLTQVRRVLDGRMRASLRPTSSRSAEEKDWRKWSRQLTLTHRDTFDTELGRRLKEAGLSEDGRVKTPPREDFMAFVVEHGLYDDDPLAASVAAYTDDAFDRLVRADVTATADPAEATALRHPLNRDRWKATLKAVSQEHQGRNHDTDQARVRAGRFHQALMQRQGEANRVGPDLAARVRDYVAEANQVTTRRRIIDEVIVWLADEVGETSPVPYDPAWQAVLG